MTMLPPPHEHDDLSKQEDHEFEDFGFGYGGFGYRRGYNNNNNNNNNTWISRSSEQSWGENYSIMGDHLEEEEERRKSTSNNSLSVSSKGTTSSNIQQQAHKIDEGGSWLQLGIPSQNTPPTTCSTTPLVELDLLSPPPPPHQACRPITIQAQVQAQAQAQVQVQAQAQTQTQVALEFRGGAEVMNMSYPASNLLFQHTPTTTGGGPAPIHHHHQDSNSSWTFGPIPYIGMGMGLMPPPPSPSSLRTLPFHHSHHLASYFPRPFQFPPPAFDEPGGFGPGPGPSSDIRVVDPPRRPHSGIWFMLQASPTQAKEPFLPQIPKSYLRIKDGKMTVRLLLKYLVNKLNLDSESEIEIRCRGQPLVPFLTLEHVRDNIWSHRDTTLLSEPSSSTSTSSSTSDHIMVLHYGRCA